MTLKLTYWPLKGRGFPIRALLHHAGVTFDDIFIEGAKWPETKQKLNEQAHFKYANLPFLQDNNNDPIFESMAILRYVARKYGYAAKDENGKIAEDVLQNVLNDLINPIIQARFSQPENERKAKIEKTLESLYPKFAGIDHVLSKTKFLTGEKPNYVDFLLLQAGEVDQFFGGKLYEEYPRIKAHKEALLENQSLRKYYDSVEKVPAMPPL